MWTEHAAKYQVIHDVKETELVMDVSASQDSPLIARLTATTESLDSASISSPTTYSMEEPHARDIEGLCVSRGSTGNALPYTRAFNAAPKSAKSLQEAPVVV